MSLSTLQSQLAAISNRSGKNPGVNYSSNKRHEDAIGRGLHFSVQHGHAIRSDTKFYKASILAATARQAADVPLLTLQENCITALHELGLDAYYASKLCGPDPALPLLIQQLLLQLTVLLGGSNSSNTATPCWHVLEYMLRRYDLHVKYMEEFLWTVLPTAERFPVIFHRCLQLVDLASHPSYAWMRPYAAAIAVTAGDQPQQPPDKKRRKNKSGAAIAAAATSDTTTASNHVPPRALLAQHVMKRTDLVRRVCHMASAVAELATVHHSTDSDSDTDRDSRTAVLARGKSHVLSYTAALLVEGLAWLQQAGQRRSSADSETALRAMFATVVKACGSGSRSSSGSSSDCDNSSDTDEWRGWGHVVASVIVETMELAPKALTTLTTQMLQPALTTTNASLPVQADAVAAVMAALFPPRQYTVDDPQEQNACFLPLWNGSLLGCAVLPPAVRQKLLQCRAFLPAVLTHLHRDRQMVVSPFLAALLVASWKDDTDLTLALMQEEGLASLWKEDSRIELIPSFANWMVQQGIKDKHDMPAAKTILKELHRMDPTACEQGIGQGMQGRKDDPACGELLRELLADIIPMDDDDNDKMDVDDSEKRNVGFLPPRVAIEHAEATVRLQAIERLVKSTDGGDFLLETFLRRWASDDNADVALAACKAITACLSKEAGRPALRADAVQQATAWTQEACYHWINEMAGQASNKRFLELLSECLTTAAYMAEEVARHEGQVANQLVLLELLGAHVDSPNKNIASKAQHGILLAFNDGESKSAHSGKKARHLLVESTDMWHRFTSGRFYQTTGPDKVTELQIRKKCGHTMLKAAVKSKGPALQNEKMAERVYGLCMIFLKEGSDDLDMIKNGLLWAVQRLSPTNEATVRMVTALASTGADNVNQKSAIPALTHLTGSVKDQSGKPVSSLAILLEAASRPISAKATIRLLSQAKDIISQKKTEDVWLALLPALFYSENSDKKVRDAASELLAALSESLPPTSSKSSSPNWSSLVPICEKVLTLKPSARLGGDAIISGVLSTTSIGTGIDELLRLCVLTLASCDNVSSSQVASAFNNTWLPLHLSTGGCRVVCRLLEAMENAGEQAYPLLRRWKHFGQPVLDHISKSSAEPNSTVSNIVDIIVRMLKGVTIADSKLIISSGPGSTGRRARSYSFGKTEGVSVLHPYPTEMVDTIAKILLEASSNKCSSMTAAIIAKDLLASKSWHEQVFSALPRKVRKKLASAILLYVSAGPRSVVDDFFSYLPFDTLDLLELLREADGNYASLSFLTDYVRINAPRLGTEAGAKDLSMSLLGLLKKVCGAAAQEEKQEELNFVLLSSLLALAELLELEGNTIQLGGNEIGVFIGVLSALLGGSKVVSEVRVLDQFRQRSVAQRILVALCARYPSKVVPALVPIIVSDIAIAKTRSESAKHTVHTFSSLVPSYLRYAASAEMSLNELLKEFIVATDGLEPKLRSRLYNDLATSLAYDQISSGDLSGASIGGLVTFLLAYLAKDVNSGEEAERRELALATEILSKSQVSSQLHSLLFLLQFTQGILASLDGKAVDSKTMTSSDGAVALPSLGDIQFILSGAKKKSSTTEHKKLVYLTSCIAKVFAEVLALPQTSKHIRRGEGGSSELSLRLWQDLLVVQSMIHLMLDNANSDNHDLWNSISSLVDSSREFLQDILPIPIFLASASSIIEDGGTDEIRSRALRLLADRSLSLDPDSAESSLFVDLIPVVLNVFNQGRKASSVLQQSALLAVEHIARAVHIGSASPNEGASGSKHFVAALDRSSCLLRDLAPKIDQDGFDIELFCSSALCSAALVRVVQARALPFLPRLVNPLMDCLREVDAHGSGDKVELHLAQVAVLRALVAIVEAVPQFLPPHLAAFLSTTGILSSSLRNQSADLAVISAVQRLDDSLSSRVPSRLFLPAASKAMKKCDTVSSKLSIVRMLGRSIEQAPNSEIVAQVQHIFDAISTSFEHEGPFEERAPIIEKGSNLLHTLVLKLSEVQLRRLFASLREWRGDLNPNRPDVGAERRYAYWTACSVLSKALRSIFLPCLTLTFDDAVAELEVAVDAMVGGKKRQATVELTAESMRAIRPLLVCLEYSLGADAHQGGSWVRSDDNQKYEFLLEPLGKLLEARVPKDFPVSDAETSPFQQLTQGTEGSVIACLTALASAGGNEQLWKPLNHYVLEASGNDARPEVRKAGLFCLLSLMKSLGEEYMVLLPECLPVLSELLEDKDEDISTLAKEIVSLAEELIGESLEDSLR